MASKTQPSETTPNPGLHAYPALLPCTAIAVAALLLTAASGTARALTAVLGAVALAALWHWTPDPRHRRWLWLLPLALLVGSLRLWAPWQAGLGDAAQHEKIAVEGVLIEDRLVNSDALTDLNSERNVRLRVDRWRLVPGGDWQSARGTILLRNPDENAAYGRRIRAIGQLSEPPTATLPGTFDLRRHYAVRGLKYQIWTDQLQILTSEPTGHRKLYAAAVSAREWLTSRLLNKVDNPADRAVVAAMTFGFRQPMSPTDRDVYLQSGMLHLFAISGLHVGIAFTILMLVLTLAGLPLRHRHLIAPLVLLLYVAATGMAPSAVRAWLMLAVWSVGRALPRPLVGANTVLFAAGLQLLWNPLLIISSGFQYSYLIVLTLVVGWPRAVDFLQLLQADRWWVPARFRSRHGLIHEASRWSLQLLGISLLAWLGGIGLTAWYNGLFLPWSWFWNCFAAVLAWLLLALAALKGALSIVTLGLTDGLLAIPLSWSASSVRLVAQLSADVGGAIICGRPPLAIILGWYGLLGFTALTPLARGKRLFVSHAVLAAATILIVIWHPLRRSLGPSVTIAAPAKALAPIALIESPTITFLVNTGSSRYGSGIGHWLRLRGVREIDAMLLPRDRATWNGGVGPIARAIPVARIYARTDTQAKADQLDLTAWQHGARGNYAKDTIGYLKHGQLSPATNDPTAFLVDLPASFHATLQLTSHRDHGWTAQLITATNNPGPQVTAHPNAPEAIVRQLAD